MVAERHDQASAALEKTKGAAGGSEGTWTSATWLQVAAFLPRRWAQQESLEKTCWALGTAGMALAPAIAAAPVALALVLAAFVQYLAILLLVDATNTATGDLKNLAPPFDVPVVLLAACVAVVGMAGEVVACQWGHDPEALELLCTVEILSGAAWSGRIQSTCLQCGGCCV